MIRINEHYINRFKYFGHAYNYMVKTGIWISFDKDTLEYIGIECFGLYELKGLKTMCDKCINKLIALDILEVVG